MDALDGNALAGTLAQVFALDITSAGCRCGHCGARGVFADVRVYLDAPGQVARCPSCDGVLLRVVKTPDRLVLDLGDGTSLTFALAP